MPKRKKAMLTPTMGIRVGFSPWGAFFLWSSMVLWSATTCAVVFTRGVNSLRWALNKGTFVIWKNRQVSVFFGNPLLSTLESVWKATDRWGGTYRTSPWILLRSERLGGSECSGPSSWLGVSMTGRCVDDWCPRCTYIGQVLVHQIS